MDASILEREYWCKSSLLLTVSFKVERFEVTALL